MLISLFFLLTGNHAERHPHDRPIRLFGLLSTPGHRVSHMWSILPAAEHRSRIDQASAGAFRKGIWTAM